MLIGLTGTYGCGKSLVSALLAECGAALIDADAISREMVEPGSPALEEIRLQFGGEYLTADGRLDRKRMAATVFESRERRQALNRILHPRVVAEMQRSAQKIEEAGRQTGKGSRVIVLDVPLLFEEGLERLVERTVVVTVSEAERFRRVRLRDGLGERDVVRRIAAQWPQRVKASLADHCIDNSGSPDATRRQVVRLYEEWVSQEAAPNPRGRR